MKNVKNKVYAVGLMGLSALLLLLENDATALVIVSFIAIPMFFAKENWVD